MPVVHRLAVLIVGGLLILPPLAAAQGSDTGSAAARSAGAISPMPVAPEVIARDEAGHVTVRATRTTEKIVVDGRLDEPIYQATKSFDGFIQQQPQEGAPAHERTEVWLLFDDDNLYVAAHCYQAPEQRLVANDLRRDGANIFLNDNFGVMLDTFHDRRNGFLFHTNPIGGLQDSQMFDEGSFNRDWNTVWASRSRVVEDGWIVEMAIPFKSLRYKAGREQVWGINFRRIVQARAEHSFLTRLPASAQSRALARVSQAATLVGLEIGRNPRQFEMKPYVTASVETNTIATPPRSNEFDPDAGLDAKIGLSSGLTLDLTWNTDFSQVEEDELQANLTRFNLFFPERREFFLEGSGIFQFGGVVNAPNPGGVPPPDNTPILFFSRRIGLEGGTTVPIQGGARLTGRAGKYQIGGLFIRAGESTTAGTPDTGFGVVRVKRDLLKRGFIGFIGTRRSRTPDGEASNGAFGVDGLIAPSQDVSLAGYVARTWTSGISGDDYSYRTRFEYAADTRGLEADYLSVGANFRPEVGFLRRTDFKRSFVQGRISPRLNGTFVRKAGAELSLEYITNGDLDLESRLVQFTPKLELTSGDTWYLELEKAFEYIAEPFDVARDVQIPIGAYHFQHARMVYTLGPNRRAPGNVVIGYGTFYEGDRFEISYRGRVEVTSRFSVEPNLSLNHVDVPWGDAWVKVLGGRFTATLTPRLAASALMQFSSNAQALGSSARLRWEYRPGSDFFLVYTDGRTTEGIGRPQLQSRTFAVKFTRLFRF